MDKLKEEILNVDRRMRNNLLGGKKVSRYDSRKIFSEMKE